MKVPKSLLPWLVALGFALLFLATLVASQKERKITQDQEAPKVYETSSATPSATEQENQESVLVTRVIDGDTIEIESGTRIRYIGIDTPEPGECFGNEATEANSRLAAGKRVLLETDIQTHDRYGRLLAYVWLGDTLINEELVRQGIATVTTYAPNVKYTDRFLEAQKEAREKKLGLWSDNPCPTFSTSSTSSTSPSVEGAQKDCAIKGNISSSGEKIYHVPGQRYYERTKIDEGKGERWFCSEKEAIEAGWRKAKI